MIKVCFPQGCYGTYLTRCLYNYTNLRKGSFARFNFDDSGSSHQHRNDSYARTVIQACHLEHLSIKDNDCIVAVLPCANHALDYYNNQFFKQSQGQLIKYILTHLTQEEADQKLSTQWGYTGNFNNTVPRWIMREWCSFWIANVLNISYNTTEYSKIKSVAQLTTQDIVENFAETLSNLTTTLGLEIIVSADIIYNQHLEFLSVQRFHNSQSRCHQYLQDLHNGIDTAMTLNSIFDEAYIQHLLRQHNLEIQCNGLNEFPSTTKQLKLLTYETMHNTNT